MMFITGAFATISAYVTTSAITQTILSTAAAGAGTYAVKEVTDAATKAFNNAIHETAIPMLKQAGAAVISYYITSGLYDMCDDSTSQLKAACKESLNDIGCVAKITQAIGTCGATAVTVVLEVIAAEHLLRTNFPAPATPVPIPIPAPPSTGTPA
jgi:uncharacterized protein with GYD domain